MEKLRRVTQQEREGERERDTEIYREDQKKWHGFGERFLRIPPGNSTVRY